MKKNMIDALLDLMKSLTIDENKDDFKNRHDESSPLQIMAEDLKNNLSLPQWHDSFLIEDGYGNLPTKDILKELQPLSVKDSIKDNTNGWYHTPSQDHFKKMAHTKPIFYYADTSKNKESDNDVLLKNQQLNINKEVVEQINVLAKQLLKEEELGNIKYIKKSSKNKFLSIYFSKYKLKLKNNLYKLETLVHSLNDRIAL